MFRYFSLYEVNFVKFVLKRNRAGQDDASEPQTQMDAAIFSNKRNRIDNLHNEIGDDIGVCGRYDEVPYDSTVLNLRKTKLDIIELLQ